MIRRERLSAERGGFSVKKPIFPLGSICAIGLLNVVLLAAPCLSSCSSQQVYGMGQAWQRNECYKIVDAQEHGRCMASTSMSYDEYKRRIDAAKDAK